MNKKCDTFLRKILSWRYNMNFICYPKCTTCQKAKKWLDANGVSYDLRDIKEQNPSYEELKKWYGMSGLPLKKFFNTSGLLYKSMELKNKLPEMSEEEQLRLLATDGMLVKRPILINGSKVVVGFKESDYEEAVK
nr:arsenate reductase family protein [Ruminococcus sp.]